MNNINKSIITKSTQKFEILDSEVKLQQIYTMKFQR